MLGRLYITDIPVQLIYLDFVLVTFDLLLIEWFECVDKWTVLHNHKQHETPVDNRSSPKKTRVLFGAELKPRGYYLEHFWQAIIGVKVPNRSHVASIQHWRVAKSTHYRCAIAHCKHSLCSYLKNSTRNIWNQWLNSSEQFCKLILLIRSKPFF